MPPVTQRQDYFLPRHLRCGMLRGAGTIDGLPRAVLAPARTCRPPTRLLCRPCWAAWRDALRRVRNVSGYDGGTRSVASERKPATPASPCEAGFAAREEGTERGSPGPLAGCSPTQARPTPPLAVSANGSYRIPAMPQVAAGPRCAGRPLRAGRLALKWGWASAGAAGRRGCPAGRRCGRSLARGRMRPAPILAPCCGERSWL